MSPAKCKKRNDMIFRYTETSNENLDDDNMTKPSHAIRRRNAKMFAFAHQGWSASFLWKKLLLNEDLNENGEKLTRSKLEAQKLATEAFM
jgi:hypothetical protein